MREWVIQTEHILAAEWVVPGIAATNEVIAARFDGWCAELNELTTDTKLSETEHKCLGHFLKITANLRPHLIECYSLEGLPRTNNAMEGYIRSLKTRYRRVSGRKNWNAYLLRYGRSVAYYDALASSGVEYGELLTMLKSVEPSRFRAMRQLDRAENLEQLKKFRFRRNPSQYLSNLETRWEQTLTGTRQLH